MKRLSEDKIQLCGRGNKCCPIITKLEDGNYEVLDDYGNTIKVKKEELEMRQRCHGMCSKSQRFCRPV